MATGSNDTDDIRRKMALIRRELHEDVRGVVANAEAVTDWTRYLRNYPWVGLGLAFAVGYVVVPRRRPSIPSDVARQADVVQVREAVVQEKETKAKAERKGGLIGAAFGMLAPMAVRAAQSYALQYLEHWMAQQYQSQMTAGMGPATAHPQQQPGAQGGPRRF